MTPFLSSTASDSPGMVRVAAWQNLRWLRAGFSTRQGGRSTVYSGDIECGDQNLGWTDPDDAEIVAAARERFVAEVGGGAALELVTTRQRHGALISVIQADHGPLRQSAQTSTLEGDGLVSSVRGLMLGIVTADCVPVLLMDTRTHAVGAFHAGWRGTLARIVEHGVETMKLQCGSAPEDLQAAIGPAIGPCCFAVGHEVTAAFRREFTYGDELVVSLPAEPLARDAAGAASSGPASTPELSERVALDLHAANRQQLLGAGLAPEAIHTVDECTACSRDGSGRRKYFSHRAEQGVTGRMLSVIGALE